VHTFVFGAALALAVALPWLANAYLVSIAAYALAFSLLAGSAHVLTAVAGQPTLGQAAFFGAGAYTAAWTGRHWNLIGPMQLLAAVVVAAAMAAVAGVFVCRLRGIWFMLATFTVGELAYVSADQWRPFTGGSAGMTASPVALYPGALVILDGHRYLYALAWFIALAVALAFVARSRFGLVLRGIQAREQWLRANGYDTTRRLWAGYILAGAFAGAAGALMLAARGYVAPSDMNFSVSALALLAAIIGRRHLIWTCFAAVGIVALRDVAGNLLTGRGPLLLGIAFLATALFVGRRHALSGVGR
jgi:branched-chain amino acid transport system permease protein